MHELSLTQAIIETVTEAAHGAPVQRVVLEIGELTAVMPDSIRFCFEACKPGTLLAEATLYILTVPGRGRCRNCGYEMALDMPYGVCDRCDSLAIDIIAGQDFILKSMETALCA
ncbi:MAG: hydrogenase maturation nickel metallochaperone HypA [Leptolyngbyaceae cyanobacterium SM2_5_2]|nr:hydrogenase maturation nickel metallochaperone HypA [Leptolyngbyaceae cyanobacterium SM2_5_2]